MKYIKILPLSVFVLFLSWFCFSLDVNANDEKLEFHGKVAASEGEQAVVDIFLAGGFFSSDLYKGIGYTLIFPFYFPYSNFDDGFATPLYFQPYPYYLTHKGYLLKTKTDYAKSWVLDASSEYKLYEDQVNGFGFNLNYRSRNRFAMQSEINFFENNLMNNTSESLIIGNTNVLFRFTQNQYLLMHTGLGLNMSFADENHFGANFTYSMDIYPIKPLFLSARIDLGLLGHDTFVRFKSSIGIIFKRAELYGGIEIYNIEGDSFHGVFIGVKYYF